MRPGSMGSMAIALAGASGRWRHTIRLPESMNDKNLAY